MTKKRTNMALQTGCISKAIWYDDPIVPPETTREEFLDEIKEHHMGIFKKHTTPESDEDKLRNLWRAIKLCDGVPLPYHISVKMMPEIARWLREELGIKET